LEEQKRQQRIAPRGNKEKIGNLWEKNLQSQPEEGKTTTANISERTPPGKKLGKLWEQKLEEEKN